MKGVGAWGVGVWVLLVTGFMSVVWAAHTPVSGPQLENPARLFPRPSASVRPYAVDSLARAALARPLFRAGRRPAALAYDPARATQPMAAEYRQPKPVLVLVGIVAGVEPTAVIEGLPGVEGARVVRTGDVIAGLKVARIWGGEVRIVGLDTVWTLTVREPWR